MNKVFVTGCIGLALLFSEQSDAQVKFDSTAYKYGQTITSQDLSKHLHILASDEYEGRETGEKGQKMAAKYMSKHFAEWGLKPVGDNNSYYQKFSLLEQKYNTIELSIGDQKYTHWKDFIHLHRSYESTNLTSSDLMFLGYGSASDFEGVDVSNKVVVLMEGGQNKSSDARLFGNTYKLNKEKTALAYSKGAAFVLILSPKVQKYNLPSGLRHYFNKGKLTFTEGESEKNYAAMDLSGPVAASLFGLTEKKFDKAIKKLSQKYDKTKSKLKPTQPISIKTEVTSRELQTENVCGLIEGSDKKDEIIVLSAHYDHIGIKGDVVYNGADDDGTGTVSILEMAQAFSEAKKDGNGPRRSILVIGMTGEEKGLLGSEYYADHPIFPLEKTVANLNTDMIGRLDEKHEGDTNYVYLIGTDMLSVDLHNISEQINAEYNNLTFDYTYNDKDDPNQFYYRSDHYNFAKNGIPVIFYFSGIHEDYHKPTDTVDKILFEKTANIAQLIFYTAWEIANREERLRLKEKKE